MWMVKPAIHREITIDLPDVLVESLGIGAHVLAQYLTHLAEIGSDDPADHPPPPPVLCRICERQITPWWFEKHTELCMQEHKAEMDVQIAQENLTEHRAAIVKVLDLLEAQTRHSRTGATDSGSPVPTPLCDYKGHPIGPASQPSSGPSSGRASPANPQLKPRSSSRSGLGHQRARSFAVRRPLARIVELILDLCDTTLEISPPAIKDNSQDDEIRTQSPQSEGRISQVLQWQPPNTSTVDNEQGLALLAEDTSSFCKAKVEAIFRHRRILEYSERLRIEFHILVQECIDEAVAKAARIANGELSDSSESSLSSDVENEGEDEPEYHDVAETMSDIDGPLPHLPEGMQEDFSIERHSPHIPSPMTMALRNIPEASSYRRASSTNGSSRSNSPHGARTPRSYGSALSNLIHQKRASMLAPESDAGADSDSSVRSSLGSMPVRTDSPAPELSLSRVTSTREHKRRSLVLPSLASTSRQQSPTRSIAPSSPLRMAKPRIPSNGESVPSPMTSPILTHDYHFTSPIIRAQSLHQHNHRRQSSATFSESHRGPSSPRLNAVNSNPQPRAVQTSIKDFEIIKPISKGAFGSVYLTKKKVTGDYYAIKVLKKADMVAKNQVTNVKAERAIMMWQGESDFVAKLYWTFASKDYLYLVMEYLNGGDCASLVKSLGGLPEDWAKKYLAEVVLGVQHLHDRQIVHRDLKPDNLLIDQKGHLKLTDFGLSRMGLIGRQKRMQDNKLGDAPDLLKLGKRAPSIASSRSTSFDFNGGHSPAPTPGLTPALAGDLGQPSYFSLSKTDSNEPSRRTSGQRSDSGESDALANMFRRFSIVDEPSSYQRRTPIEEETVSEGESPEPYALQPVLSHMSGLGTPPGQSGMLPPPMALFDPEDSSRRFVGTPDYLAPETINGSGQDEMSDWWSLGCILFECLYGYPPFHAETPEQVFQNILDRKIDWPDDEDCPVSSEAKDLINKLMCLDPKERLGSNIDEKFANGGDEIRAHAWFADVEWDTLREETASFVPAPANPEDTEYFDSRGATLQNFRAEFEDQVSSPANTPGADYPERPHDALSRVRNQVNSIKRGLMPLHIPPHVRDGRSRRLSEPVATDDFGNFQFKNLPVLEKANKDVIQKLRAEAMQAQSKAAQGISSSSPVTVSPSPSVESSPVGPAPLKRTLSSNKGNTRPASPLLLSKSNSSPSRASQPSSPLLVSFSAAGHHERRKTSNASSLVQQMSSMQAHSNLLDAPNLPVGFKSLSAASSPIRIPKSLNMQQGYMPEKVSLPTGRRGSVSSPRQRSHTIGSQDDDIPPGPISQYKRRSMAIDASPSSSDNEESRAKALLRVQRRRQSTRRLSQITLADGPAFRPLDVLICEDHPVSRLVMERLLEKLRCRTIAVQDGSEAMRYAMSEVKFDIIMMEFKLPQINGADVARMIRDTKNANSHTPIVAVTGYLKELQAPHYFDALIEKPPDTAKLTEVMSRLCQWKVPPPGWTPAQIPIMPSSSLRRESPLAEESPTTSSISGYGILTNSFRGSSREDSIGSCSIPETDSPYDSIQVVISQQANDDEWHEADLERQFGGLGISPEDVIHSRRTPSPGTKMPTLEEQVSAPGKLESSKETVSSRKHRSSEAIEARKKSHEVSRHECAESGDDEDEELGNNAQNRERSPKSCNSKTRGASKLGTEMLRTNSQGSVVSNEEVMATQNLKATAPLTGNEEASIEEEEGGAATLTPPEVFEPQRSGGEVRMLEVDMDVDVDTTPRAHYTSDPDPNPTPRASTSPARIS
jgi:serine/threonine-protein kinase RIM15